MIRVTGRALRLALASLIVAITAIQIASTTEAWAQNVSNAPVIFDVRRSLQMEPDEPVFHDFYINAGPETGLKKGMFVNVVRQVPIHDPIQNKQQAILNVTVGKLQVIFVDRGITVARLNSELANEDRPVLEFEAIMIGDKIDLASGTMEAPKLKAKPGKPEAVKAVEPQASAAVTAPATEETVIELRAAETIPQKALDAASPAPPAPPVSAPPARETVPQKSLPVAPKASSPGTTASFRVLDSIGAIGFNQRENASSLLAGPDMVRRSIPSEFFETWY